MLNERLQLIFQILGLLTGEAGDRKISMKALCRTPVTIFAIVQLGLYITPGPRRSFRPARIRHRQGKSQQHQLQRGCSDQPNSM
jgi:hypothetical protein